MKRLIAFLVLCLPICLFAQGFGSFSHDQPFFAKDSTGLSSDPCTFAPTNLSGCFFWIRMETNSVLSKFGTNAVSGQIIGQWKDLSGNGNHVSNNVSGTGPTVQTVGAGAPYSVGFGIDTGNRFLTNLFMTTKTNPFTLFAAVYPIATENGHFLIGSGANNFSVQQYPPTDNLRVYHPAGFNYSGVIENVWVVFTAQMDKANSLIRTNGVLAGSGDTTTANITGGFIIGNDWTTRNTFNAFDGFLKEMIMYDRLLTTNELRQVETYLGCRNSIIVY